MTGRAIENCLPITGDGVEVLVQWDTGADEPGDLLRADQPLAGTHLQRERIQPVGLECDRASTNLGHKGLEYDVVRRRREHWRVGGHSGGGEQVSSKCQDTCSCSHSTSGCSLQLQIR